MKKFVLVLEVLKKSKLTLNIKKRRFGMREIEFLGFIISEGGIKPGELKVEAIKNFPRPINVHHLLIYWSK